MTDDRRRVLDDLGTAIRLDKIDKLETLDEKLQLVYEWVKTGHMNLTQFKRLTKDIIVADFQKRAGLTWTED